MDSLIVLAMSWSLPPYYLEVVLSGATVVVYRGGYLLVLFETFSKGPRGLSYVFLITGKVPTLSQ